MLGIELPAFIMANKTRKCAALGTHFWAMDREKRENPMTDVFCDFSTRKVK